MDHSAIVRRSVSVRVPLGKRLHGGECGSVRLGSPTPLPIVDERARIRLAVSETAPPSFLDVPVLLQRSVPRPRAPLMGYLAGGVVLALVIATLNVQANGLPGGQDLARVMS